MKIHKIICSIRMSRIFIFNMFILIQDERERERNHCFLKLNKDK